MMQHDVLSSLVHGSRLGARLRGDAPNEQLAGPCALLSNFHGFRICSRSTVRLKVSVKLCPICGTSAQCPWSFTYACQRADLGTISQPPDGISSQKNILRSSVGLQPQAHEKAARENFCQIIWCFANTLTKTYTSCMVSAVQPMFD